MCAQTAQFFRVYKISTGVPYYRFDKYPVPKDAADARDNEIKENTNQGSPSPMFQEKETSPNDKRFGATATADTVGD